MADVEIIEIFNLFPELPAVLQAAVIRATKKAAFDIQALAADSAPIDFGFLKSSIYVVTKDASTYGQGITPGAPGSYLLPEVERPTSPTIAYIAVGANYGIYQETGTVHMPAHPYLTPAAELVMPEYLAALEALEGSLEL